MTTLHFKCTFISDVILNANSATEGVTEILEYIPGAKFLGIVAKKLYNSTADTITLFHSGKVRFGDAHLSKNGQRSIKTPFDFFKAKVGHEGKIWIGYLHNENELNDIRTKQHIQLKQDRSGYFIQSDGKNTKLKNKASYSLKSAYNADERRTKEKQMFGYNAMKKGSVWLFSVEIDDEAGIEKNTIIDALDGEHGLGKSRSAQYGRVKIEYLNDSATTPKEHSTDTLVLYAESNWCFLDANGQPTVKPTIEQLKLKQGEIDWEKSQIRYRFYAPWNVKRAARDADRWVIEKGSVLIIKNAGTVCESQFEKGIGSFRTEGLGKVLVNPEFLTKDKELHFEEDVDAEMSLKTAAIKALAKDKIILQLLNQQKERDFPQSNISNQITVFINTFKNKFEGITASQWGQIRAIVQNITKDKHLDVLLFNKDVGFLYTAKRKNTWAKSAQILEQNCKNWSNNFEDKKAFLLALASEMAKIAQQQPKQQP